MSQPVTILLVEDNPVNQKVASGLLKRGGHVVEVVADGQQALAALENARYDLVFMDVQMPVMDGLTATRAIRRDLRLGSLPIVALTANAMPGDREECLASGMDDYVSKPITSENLDAMVAKWAPHAQDASGAETGAAGAAVRGSEPVDSAALLEVVDGDREFAASLVGDLVTLGHEQLAQLRDGLARADMPACRELAHSLKGGAAALGANDLSAAAHAAEIAAKTSGPDAVAAQVPTIEAALAAVEQWAPSLA